MPLPQTPDYSNIFVLKNFHYSWVFVKSSLCGTSSIMKTSSSSFEIFTKKTGMILLGQTLEFWAGKFQRYSKLAWWTRKVAKYKHSFQNDETILENSQTNLSSHICKMTSRDWTKIIDHVIGGAYSFEGTLVRFCRSHVIG